MSKVFSLYSKVSNQRVLLVEQFECEDAAYEMLDRMELNTTDAGEFYYVTEEYDVDTLEDMDEAMGYIGNLA